MESRYMEFDTLEQQQAVFGIQDCYAKHIERAFSIALGLRDGKVELRGESAKNIELAMQVLETMQEMYEKGQAFSMTVVHQLMEEALAGALDETVHAMESVVTLTDKGKPIRCKTLGQQKYVEALRKNVVTICIGPAGTGKTYLAVAQAVKELRDGEIDRIVMSRPAIEAGEERLGFLPGDLAQKVDPYLRPLYDALHDILGAEKAEKLRERGTIEIAPLAYMRGRTLNRARVLIDESQNASLATLKMALTRLGEDSKIVLTGDVTQIDLPKTVDSGLEKCAEILKGIEGIAVTRLGNRDVVRNKIVKDIVKAFEREEQKQEAKKIKNVKGFRKNEREKPRRA